MHVKQNFMAVFKFDPQRKVILGYDIDQLAHGSPLLSFAIFYKKILYMTLIHHIEYFLF
ncbi:hypothetical protein SBF1_3120002 [Candidatus Desulfosporosinus infrequens]|uniref:Uncharacterized protein n=1 Tax=Candidatus Desulfosporosinus infrequens TaxID=2043169 RepID=A0A2U3KZ54_9FIRM|nr:hypothetical protein SBF1_3120002 [Candidatus Desulfosporosinus infrequens]